MRGRGDFAENSIFVPAAGCGYGPSLFSASSYGNLWSSVPCSGGSWSLHFYSGDHGMDNYVRADGLSIRPVRGATE